MAREGLARGAGWGIGCVCLAGLTALSACGAGSLLSHEASAPPTFLDRLEARVDAARDQAHWRLRHNPVRRGCPPWEVRVQDVWHRVHLHAGEDASVVATLDAAVASEPPGAAPAREVDGALEGRLEICGRGAVLLFLRVDGLRPLEPPPVTTDDDPPPEDED